MTSADRTMRLVTRLLAACGLVVGGALLVRPQQVADRVAPAFPHSKLWLARALGVRLLLQHGAVLVHPDRTVVRASSAVDLIHAASMVPFVASSHYGQAARISGGLAAAYGATALTLAEKSEGR